MLIVITFKQFYKLTSNSKLTILIYGLNRKRRIYSMLYFIHFFGLRIIIALLIGLSDQLPSLVLWSVFLGF